MEHKSRVLRGVWAACLLIAALNHARLLFQHGLFWNYGGVAWPNAAYWSSLAVLDPFTATLLFVRPRLGIALTLLLLATNVLHNLAVTAQRVPKGAFLSLAASNPFLLSQIGFLLFALATARTAWRGAEERRRPLALRS